MMTRALGSQLDEPFKAEIERADDWVDQALTVLESNEEPRVAKWLDTDEDLQAVLTANATAVYWSIVNQLNRGRSLDQAMVRVDALIERVAHAAALHAVKMDRGARYSG